jgi:hypothetical protein
MVIVVRLDMRLGARCSSPAVRHIPGAPLLRFSQCLGQDRERRLLTVHPRGKCL